ncbi:MAG: ABC transporter substrate-binding protein [Thermodesulfobacteriota bacterium]
MGRVVCVLAFLLLMGSSVSADAGSEPIRVAALYNLTGEMASIDAPALRGAKLAAALVNRQGGLLRGRMIEIVSADTRTDEKIAAKEAERLAKLHVVAGIGYGDTTFVLAAAPAFHRRAVPFITSGATAPDLPERFAPNLFMVAYGDDAQAAAMADFAGTNLGIRSVAIWTDTSFDFTRLLSGFFRQAYTARGGKVVAEETFSGDQKDFSELVSKLKATNPLPDALYISAVPGDAVASVTAVRKAGLSIPILSGDGFDCDLLQSLRTKDLADGIYFSTHRFRLADRPEIRSFIDAYTKEYGNPPENAFAALGFDAMNLLIHAIKRSRTTDVKVLRGALALTRGFKAVTGEISYADIQHPPRKPVSIIAIKQGAYSVARIVEPKLQQ